MNLFKGVIVVDDSHKISESVALWESLGGIVLNTYVFNIHKIHSRYYLGPGQLQSIEIISGQKVFCDIQVSPGNRRAMEDLLKKLHSKPHEFTDIEVWDRTEVILRIFTQRALSAEGKLQVKMANYLHQKRKLIGSQTHLERQRGRISFIGGPGELQKELDKRQLELKIESLKDKLKKIKKQRAIRRRQCKTIALVGYTNVGKTQALKILSGDKEVMPSDKLFATLDPKSRFCHLDANNHVLVMDTVGFITNLPHMLVDAFHATLEEAKYADLILHIHDISDPDYLEKGQIVLKVLHELSVDSKKVLNIWNKSDLIPGCIPPGDGYLVSSKTGAGWDKVKKMIADKFIFNKKLFLKNLSIIQHPIIECKPVQDGYLITLRIDDAEFEKIRSQIKQVHYSK